jgi:diguanylate cyclase (GGDEF)-like protein/PAS domain S-box-containing protein
VDELRASQDRYRALVELSPDAIAVIQDGHFVFANQQALQLVGAKDIEELGAWPALDVVPLPAHTPLTERYNDLPTSTRPPYIEGQLIRMDDQRRIPIETAAAGIEYEGGPAVMVVVRDISARHASAQAVRAAEQRFAAAFHEVPIAMLLIDPMGIVLDANPALGELVGKDPRGLVGGQSMRLVHHDDRDRVSALLRSAAERDETGTSLECRLERSGDGPVWVQGSVAPLPGHPKALVLYLLDVTERRAKEARLAYRALHDPLTGLPNRTLLTDRLEQAVRAAIRGKGGVAVLYLDLDGFKEVNDTYGHATGDDVLVEVARRLRAAVRPADTVARLGGDEYAVVAEGLPERDALALVERVREALGPPIGALNVAVSVGGVHSSDAGLDADALLHAADTDMYRAKRARLGTRPDPADPVGSAADGGPDPTDPVGSAADGVDDQRADSA